MSHVKTKNLVAKALAAAAASEGALKGCQFETTLEQGKIVVAIIAAPFCCLKDDSIRLHDDGTFSYVIDLFGKGEQSSFTAEAETLKENVKALVAAVAAGTGARHWVYFGDACFRAQARAKRAAMATGAAA